jgi:hypothetical protein
MVIRKLFLSLIFASVIIFSNVVILEAGPIGPATHMGQTYDNHVTLEVVGGLNGGCGPAKLDFVRVLPNGNMQSGAGGLGWRVPKGKVLVVTDVDWQYVHPNGAASAGQMQILRLFIENLADPTLNRRAFESPVILSNTGAGGVSASMTSGFIVSNAARICPDVIPGPLGPPSGLQHLILRGYLAPASFAKNIISEKK